MWFSLPEFIVQGRYRLIGMTEKTIFYSMVTLMFL